VKAVNSIEFLFADPNGPFLVAMAVTLLIAGVEGVSLVLGLGLSDLIDDLLPDLDGGLDSDVGADLDGDGDLDGLGHSDANILVQAFGWLNAGRVPFLILLITCLASFAVIGYAGQMLASAVIGLLPAAIAAPSAAIVTLPATRSASRVLGRIVPREETYAVGEGHFIGSVGTVTLGRVESDNPGKARVLDAHGNVHYVRVRAAEPDKHYDMGSEVLLVRREGAIFDVISPPDSLTGR
jgi:hypothetical protein